MATTSIADGEKEEVRIIEENLFENVNDILQQMQDIATSVATKEEKSNKADSAADDVIIIANIETSVTENIEENTENCNGEKVVENPEKSTECNNDVGEKKEKEEQLDNDSKDVEILKHNVHKNVASSSKIPESFLNFKRGDRELALVHKEPDTFTYLHFRYLGHKNISEAPVTLKKITFNGLHLGDLFNPTLYTLMQLAENVQFQQKNGERGTLHLTFSDILDRFTHLRRYLLDFEIAGRTVDIECNVPSDHVDVVHMWKTSSQELAPPCKSTDPERQMLARQLVLKKVPDLIGETEILNSYKMVEKVEFAEDYEKNRCAILTFADVFFCHIAHSRRYETKINDIILETYLMAEMASKTKFMPLKLKEESEEEIQTRNTFNVLWYSMLATVEEIRSKNKDAKNVDGNDEPQELSKHARRRVRQQLRKNNIDDESREIVESAQQKNNEGQGQNKVQQIDSKQSAAESSPSKKPQQQQQQPGNKKQQKQQNFPNKRPFDSDGGGYNQQFSKKAKRQLNRRLNNNQGQRGFMMNSYGYGRGFSPSRGRGQSPGVKPWSMPWNMAGGGSNFASGANMAPANFSRTSASFVGDVGGGGGLGGMPAGYAGDGYPNASSSTFYSTGFGNDRNASLGQQQLSPVRNQPYGRQQNTSMTGNPGNTGTTQRYFEYK